MNGPDTPFLYTNKLSITSGSLRSFKNVVIDDEEISIQAVGGHMFQARSLVYRDSGEHNFRENSKKDLHTKFHILHFALPLRNKN